VTNPLEILFLLKQELTHILHWRTSIPCRVHLKKLWKRWLPRIIEPARALLTAYYNEGRVSSTGGEKYERIACQTCQCSQATALLKLNSDI
jgi:hypothetical protein